MEIIGGLKTVHSASVRRFNLPIVFIHGMWAGSWCFRNLQKLAEELGWESYAVNLWGHYCNDRIDNLGRVSFWDYVRDIRTFLDEIGPAYLVGHSMGGLICQSLAGGNNAIGHEPHPNVRGVILLASAPPAGIYLPWSVIWTAAKYADAMFFSRPFLPSESDFRKLVLNNCSREAKQYALEMFGGESGRAAREILLGGIRVEKANCPVLVVAGSEDKLIPPDIQMKIARFHGQGNWLCLPYDHMIPMQIDWNWGSFILEWLE